MASATQTPLVQPPFATQLSAARDLALGYTPHLQKGWMVWDVAGGNNGALGYTGGPYDGRATFHFMYNPQSVSANFATEATNTQAAMLYNNPGASNLLAIPLSQSAQWTLYFDRTFEVNYNRPNNTVNDPAVIGVQADVLQMMQFTGMMSNKAAGLSAIKTPVVNKGGVMLNIQSWVYFGNNVPPRGGPYSKTIAENRMGYYGFINSWAVNYTAFTQNMVPYRCTMDVSFQMLPSTSATQATGAMAQGVLDPFGNLKNYVAPKKAKTKP